MIAWGIDMLPPTNEPQVDTRVEVDRNYEAFVKILPTLMAEHPNKYALMRGGEVMGLYSTLEDVYTTAGRFLKGEQFSVQKVTNIPVDLGFFSHAVHIG